MNIKCLRKNKMRLVLYSIMKWQKILKGILRKRKIERKMHEMIEKGKREFRKEKERQRMCEVSKN
jgi:hypothetical protein